MKLYNRLDFLKLPKGAIYSKVDDDSCELMFGLFCKVSSFEEMQADWVEQDLISECGFPNKITDGIEASVFQLNLRDTYQDFETDLNCSGRDGAYEEKDKFVVWDKNDIVKLRDYFDEVLKGKGNGVI